MKPDDDRRRLRRALRAARARLDLHDRIARQRRALARLKRLACYRRARHVGLYLGLGAELAPQTLTDDGDKRFYLPIVRPDGLRFAARGRRMRPNRIGIPEPIDARPCPPTVLDLVVVPMVGFDADCNRLGMGGGYYDRSFAFRLTRPNAGPRLVGLAFECQRMPALDVADWDVPMDLVVTEAGVQRPRRVAVGAASA